MSIRLITITGPATAVLTTAEAKTHLRVTHSSDDTYIDGLVDTARTIVESRSGWKMFTQTLELRADSFNEKGLADPTAKDIIGLRVAPVASITSIKYYNTADSDTEISNTDYWTDLLGVPCRLQIKNSWPSTNERIGNVRIRLVAGTVKDKIPEHLLLAVKLLVGHWYENREETITGTQINTIPEGVNRIIFSSPEFHHYSTGSI